VGGRPRWQWHAALLDELAVTTEEAPPSSGAHFLQDLLSDMPLSELEQSHHVLEFEFEDADTFWTWCWSHGWRGVMERLTAEQLDGYRKGAFDYFGDGPVPGQLRADLVTATTIVPGNVSGGVGQPGPDKCEHIPDGLVGFATANRLPNC